MKNQMSYLFVTVLGAVSSAYAATAGDILNRGLLPGFERFGVMSNYTQAQKSAIVNKELSGGKRLFNPELVIGHSDAINDSGGKKADRDTRHQYVKMAQNFIIEGMRLPEYIFLVTENLRNSKPNTPEKKQWEDKFINLYEELTGGKLNLPPKPKKGKMNNIAFKKVMFLYNKKVQQIRSAHLAKVRKFFGSLYEQCVRHSPDGIKQKMEQKEKQLKDLQKQLEPFGKDPKSVDLLKKMPEKFLAIKAAKELMGSGIFSDDELNKMANGKMTKEQIARLNEFLKSGRFAVDPEAAANTARAEYLKNKDVLEDIDAAGEKAFKDVMNRELTPELINIRDDAKNEQRQKEADAAAKKAFDDNIAKGPSADDIKTAKDKVAKEAIRFTDLNTHPAAIAARKAVVDGGYTSEENQAGIEAEKKEVAKQAEKAAQDAEYAADRAFEAIMSQPADHEDDLAAQIARMNQIRIEEAKEKGEAASQNAIAGGFTQDQAQQAAMDAYVAHLGARYSPNASIEGFKALHASQGDRAKAAARRVIDDARAAVTGAAPNADAIAAGVAAKNKIRDQRAEAEAKKAVIQAIFEDINNGVLKDDYEKALNQTRREKAKEAAEAARQAVMRAPEFSEQAKKAGDDALNQALETEANQAKKEAIEEAKVKAGNKADSLVPEAKTQARDVIDLARHFVNNMGPNVVTTILKYMDLSNGNDQSAGLIERLKSNLPLEAKDLLSIFNAMLKFRKMSPEVQPKGLEDHFNNLFAQAQKDLTMKNVNPNFITSGELAALEARERKVESQLQKLKEAVFFGKQKPEIAA